MRRLALGFAFGGLAISLVASSAGCSSDKPAEFDDPDVPGHDTNPDGVAYPTDHIGKEPRSPDGMHRGDRIENFTFQGYDHANVGAGLKTFSMADYFDPTAKRYKVIAIQAAGTWCSICSTEATTTSMVGPGLEMKGAAILAIVVNGPSVNYGPSLTDVDQWITGHGSNTTTLIDVRARRLGTVGLTGVPWSALVDARTMEILFASDGSPDDYVTFVDNGLKMVETYDPAY